MNSVVVLVNNFLAGQLIPNPMSRKIILLTAVMIYNIKIRSTHLYVNRSLALTHRKILLS